MFERNPDTIETNGSKEWDQQNGYVHSLMKYQILLDLNWSKHEELLHTPVVYTGLQLDPHCIY